MAKFFSVLTLLVALAATFFGFQTKGFVERLQITAKQDHEELLEKRATLKKTQKELADTKAELETTKDTLAKTQKELADTKAELEKTKADLVTTQTKLTDAEGQLAAIKEKLKIFGDANIDDLQKQITDTKNKLTDLEAKVVTYEKEIAELKTVNDTLTTQKKEGEEKIASQHKVIDRYQKNVMQKGIRGEVLAVNAGWGFCVLSIGDRKGAAANKIMIVVRGGQAIGKVKIVNVEASQSVADIIPSSFVRGAYVQPGDEVIYTGEDKVREEPVADGGAAAIPTTSPLIPELPHN